MLAFYGEVDQRDQGLRAGGRRGPDWPLIDPAVQLTDVISDAARAAYAQLVATAVADNGGAPAWVASYLQEAFYLLPVFLALQLQGSRQDPAALDWFRTVYDYAQPEGQRAIWPPLALLGGGGAPRGRRTGCSIRWIPIR